MTKVNAINATVKSLANQEPVKNHYSMGSETITLLENWSGLTNKAGKAQDLLIDDLYNKGYKPFHFVDMRETEDKQGAKFRDSILRHIVLGWSNDRPKDQAGENSEEYKLYYASEKSLSQQGLALQAFHRNSARVAYNNMKQALKNRIEKGDKKEKAKQASQMVMALREIKSAMKRMKDESKSPYAGIADDLKILASLKILSAVKDTK